MSELPKIVRERLAQMPAGPHPDPDLLTAFAEHSLAPRERGLVMAHVSGCQECRQLISLAALPLRDAEPSPSLAEPARGWFSWGYMRWSGAVAAVLVVASIALLYEDRWRHPELSPVPPPATAKLEAPPAADRQAESPASTPSQSKPAQPAPARELELRRDARANAPPPPPPAIAVEDRAVGGASAGARSQTSDSAAGRQEPSPDKYRAAQIRELPANEQEQTGELKKEKDEKLDSLALSPAPGSASKSVATEGGKSALPARTPAAPDVAAPAARSSELSAEVASTTDDKRAAKNAKVSRPARTLGGYTFSTSDAGADWRTTSAGTVERLNDGKTWSTTLSVPGVRFTALAALGTSVWAGGSDGVVYVSTDNGRRWVRRQIHIEGAPITEDVRALFLEDPRSGRADTATGTYITNDAGATWNKLDVEQ